MAMRKRNHLLSATPDAGGQVTFDLTKLAWTSTVGTFGFIAKFSDSGNYGSSSSACLDLTITLGDGGGGYCPAGQNATISVTFVNSPGFPLPGTYTWNLRISIHACKDLTNVSAQGGKNAWTGATFRTPTEGSVKLRKATGGNNEVSIWTIGSMVTGDTVDLPVSVTGSIKPKTRVRDRARALGSLVGLSTSQEFARRNQLTAALQRCDHPIPPFRNNRPLDGEPVHRSTEYWSIANLIDGFTASLFVFSVELGHRVGR
jgi:hypothetical protein